MSRPDYATSSVKFSQEYSYNNYPLLLKEMVTLFKESCIQILLANITLLGYRYLFEGKSDNMIISLPSLWNSLLIVSIVTCRKTVILQSQHWRGLSPSTSADVDEPFYLNTLPLTPIKWQNSMYLLQQLNANGRSDYWPMKLMENCKFLDSCFCLELLLKATEPKFTNYFKSYETISK